MLLVRLRRDRLGEVLGGFLRRGCLHLLLEHGRLQGMSRFWQRRLRLRLGLGLGIRFRRRVRRRFRRRLRGAPADRRRHGSAARQSQIHPSLEELDPRAKRGHLAARLTEGKQGLPVPLGEAAKLGQQLTERARLEDRLGWRGSTRGRWCGGDIGLAGAACGSPFRLEVDAHAALTLVPPVQDAPGDELPDALLGNTEDVGRLTDRVAVRHRGASVAVTSSVTPARRRRRPGVRPRPSCCSGPGRRAPCRRCRRARAGGSARRRSSRHPRC